MLVNQEVHRLELYQLVQTWQAARRASQIQTASSLAQDRLVLFIGSRTYEAVFVEELVV